MSKKKEKTSLKRKIAASAMSSNAVDLRAEQIKETKKKFLENCRLPETLGFGVGEEAKEVRTAMDAAFSDNVGMDAIFETLADHAVDMGQFPYTSFVGYGVLQQIAQNGMIRNCIKTVADDITRSWITIKGGEETPPGKNCRASKRAGKRLPPAIPFQSSCGEGWLHGRRLHLCPDNAKPRERRRH